MGTWSINEGKICTHSQYCISDCCVQRIQGVISAAALEQGWYICFGGSELLKQFDDITVGTSISSSFAHMFLASMEKPGAHAIL